MGLRKNVKTGILASFEGMISSFTSSVKEAEFKIIFPISL